MKRQLLYSFINIIGLAVGLACSLVIFIYVFGEWSHDRHYQNAERIYRVGVSFYNMGWFASAPELLSDVLQDEFTGIEAVTKLKKNAEENLRIKNESFRDLVYYADSSFFKVFSYEFIKGNPSEVLNKPNSAVLTQAMAIKYFGTEKVMGEIIEVGKEKIPYVVTGLVKNVDNPSHLKAEIWLTLDLPKDKKYLWTSASVFNYVLLKEGVIETDLKKALDKIIEKHVYPASGWAAQGITAEQYLKDDNAVKFNIQPLQDIYLYSKVSFELSPGGNATNVKIFAVIAIIIVVLAAVNFVNLSTARASRRAKEVGIRKSLGTSKNRLVSQFLIESVLISMFAMLLGLGFAEIFGFIFHWITGQHLSFNILGNWISMLLIFSFALIVGVVSGLYPAFYMTSFETAKVLKGSLKFSTSYFRSALIVFQFAISIGLILCTSVILMQLNYMSEKSLGFNQENIITIDDLYKVKNNHVDLREWFKQQPEVINASLHSGEPGSKDMMYFYTFQTPEMTESITINTYFIDHAFADLMGFKLLEGRNFNNNILSDTASVILNESAVKALGLVDPIGKEVNKGVKVIGVVSDFHWESLRNNIAPLVLMFRPDGAKSSPYHQLALKVIAGSEQSILKKADTRWKSLVADEPLRYHFMDDNFGALLRKEAILGKAIVFFTILAIIISCLGLFGLSAYTAESRTKEIGIRKVLGASSTVIMMLLNKQFSTLILIAIAITIPLSLYICNQWLANFAYHTEIPVWLYLISAFIGWLISYITVAFHTLKASRTNPAETLKYE